MNRIATFFALTIAISVATYAQPPGFERVVPGVETEMISWAFQDDFLYGGKFYDPSKRIIDFEVVLHKPDKSKVFGHKLAVQVVRCPNEGVLEANSGFMFAAPAPEIMKLVIDQTRRATDIEVSIIDGEIRYSVVTVMNEGQQESLWQWIPLAPIDDFFALLNMAELWGWRPTDIEFVRHDNQTFATCLLAPIPPTNKFIPYQFDSAHFGFSPNNQNLAIMQSQGWQPIDIEHTPFLDDQSQYYGVFVRTSNTIQEAYQSEAIVSYETPEEVIFQVNLQGTDLRLVDIEGYPRSIGGKKGLSEGAPPNTFATIHVHVPW